MNYFMYSNESSVTGKAILQALKDAGVEVRGGHEPPANARIDNLVRWGSTRQIALKPGRVINKLKAVNAASQKLVALQTMDATGVRVPPIYTDAINGFPVLARKERHVGGKDIKLCLQMTDVNRARELGYRYFTRYIPTKAEYRVHVFGDEAIKISQKILTDAEAADAEPWIRNLDAGYTFREPRVRLGDSDLAIRAVNALGLDFGAVDLIVSDDNIPYILEVNTAPGLIETGIETYVEKFTAVFGDNA